MCDKENAYSQYLSQAELARELKDAVDSLYDPERFIGFNKYVNYNKYVKYMRAVTDKIITMDEYRLIKEFY